jgi:N-acetylmuramic acid-specific PTS system IIC component
LFEHLTSGYVAIFGCMLLTFVFLFCLIFGIHTCFIPIYVALMSTQGVNFVFPLLGMAGAAQVGTAIILSWLSKKGSKFRKDIGACIVSGVLGIDEPLLYGVNLPRIIPLFTAAMGAAVGGLFIGLMVSPIANIHMGVQQVFGVNGV